jgi:WD40 repeat protein
MTESDRKALYEEGMAIRRRLEALKSSGSDGKAERDQLRARYTEIDQAMRKIKADGGAAVAEWAVGDVILDEYEVTGVLGEGGMGKVYKVHHRNWDMDMAVKCPQPKAIRTQAQKGNFVRECHTWMDLGLHNHIATCHYVRVLDDVPRVFAEFVDGGSLKDWIEEGRLYEGSADEALERILDVAIQFAWGLQYSHEKGLIHQHVKPDNVMMTSDGVAKVTDFGLANARAVEGEDEEPPEGHSIMASYGGMTPAYCSPEQADNAARRQGGIRKAELTKLTKRTDIYSWAVSVFEMFNGGVTWQAGNVVGHALETYLDDGPGEDRLPTMPESISNLLKKCLSTNPSERPNDFNEVVEALKTIYEESVGRAYPNETPAPPTELADVLNNKALSFLELNDPEKAEELWDSVIEADIHNVAATYNRGLMLWRADKIQDTQLISNLEEICNDNSDDWAAFLAMGWVRMEHGDSLKAKEEFSRAGQLEENPEISAALAQAKPREDLDRNFPVEFEGHLGEVHSVAFSPNGRFALSGAGGLEKDHTLKLWDISTGNCKHTFEGHNGSVRSAAFSPDGKSVLSGSWDHMLRLWNVSTGRCERTLEGHGNQVYAVAFSPDGRFALSAGGDLQEDFEPKVDCSLKLWDVSTGHCTRSFEDHGSIVYSVAFSPDGCRALSGGRDHNLKLWDVGTGRCVRTLKGHSSIVTSVAFSPDGNLALSGSQDNSVKLWDVTTGDCLRTFNGHTSWVTSVLFSPDGKLGLSGCADCSVKVWELASIRSAKDLGRCLRTFKGFRQKVNAVAISGDGNFVLAGSSDHSLRLWPVGKSVLAPKLFSTVVKTSVVLERENEYKKALASAEIAFEKGDYSRALEDLIRARSVAGFNNAKDAIDLQRSLAPRLRIKSYKEAWLSRTFEGRSVSSAAFSPDGNQILSWPAVWDAITGERIHTFEGRNKTNVSSVVISPDGSSALSTQDSPEFFCWEVRTGHILQTYKDHKWRVDSVHFSPDGKWIVSGSRDKTIKLWESSTGRCLRTFEGHASDIFAVAINPDGRFILSGGGSYPVRKSNGSIETGESSIKLWEIASGRCLRTFEGHTRPVQSVAISPDGCTALSGAGTGDNTLKLWDLETGRCLRTFVGHESGVYSVAFTPDGRFAFSGSGDHGSKFDNTLRLWDVESGDCLRIFEGHDNLIRTIAISPDGRFVGSGSGGTLNLWEVEWELEAPEAADWDDGAYTLLEFFLTIHTPYVRNLDTESKLNDEDVSCALTRKGKPAWTEEDFDQLVRTLGCAGYGWLRPDGIRHRLEEMAETWTEPPPSPGVVKKGKATGLFKGLFGKKK